MYYEEKIIDGVLCWRNNPDDEFTPYTAEQLSRKYEQEKEQTLCLREIEEELRAQLARCVDALEIMLNVNVVEADKTYGTAYKHCEDAVRAAKETRA